MAYKAIAVESLLCGRVIFAVKLKLFSQGIEKVWRTTLHTWVELLPAAVGLMTKATGTKP